MVTYSPAEPLSFFVAYSPVSSTITILPKACHKMNTRKPGIDVFMFQVLKQLLYLRFLLHSFYTDSNFHPQNRSTCCCSSQSYNVTTFDLFVFQCSFQIPFGITLFQISHLETVLPSFSYYLDFIWAKFWVLKSCVCI